MIKSMGIGHYETRWKNMQKPLQAHKAKLLVTNKSENRVKNNSPRLCVKVSLFVDSIS